MRAAQQKLAGSGRPLNGQQRNLLELADRIDYEQLWRRADDDRRELTPEQRDRRHAGAALRELANLWSSGYVVIFLPVSPVRVAIHTADGAMAAVKQCIDELADATGSKQSTSGPVTASLDVDHEALLLSTDLAAAMQEDDADDLAARGPAVRAFLADLVCRGTRSPRSKFAKFHPPTGSAS